MVQKDYPVLEGYQMDNRKMTENEGREGEMENEMQEKSLARHKQVFKGILLFFMHLIDIM